MGATMNASGRRGLFRCGVALGAMSLLLRGDSCGSSDPGPGQGCPQAQALYDYAQTVYDEMTRAVRFGSRWEMTVETKYVRRAELRTLLVGYDVDGQREYESRTVVTFEIPKAPARLTCQQAIDAQAMDAYDPGVGKEYLKEQHALALMELIGFSGIAATGQGTHQARVEPSISRTVTFPVPPCSYPNPCPEADVEKSGCSFQGEHQTSVRLGVSWEPGQLLGLLGTLSVEPKDLKPPPTQTKTVNNIGWQDQQSTDICQLKVPFCKGRTSEEIECWSSGANFDFDEEPPLREGTYVVFSSNSATRVSSTRVSLRCTSGCECDTAAQCDDGRLCTRDECVEGNCKHTVDDLIEPPQVKGDCRTCEGGEVHSVREDVDRECNAIRNQVISTCRKGSDNWLVHWVDSMAGAESTYHMCNAGTDPGAATVSVCAGSGTCKTGQKFSHLEGTIDRVCHSYDGQDLTFTCDVFCSYCQ